MTVLRLLSKASGPYRTGCHRYGNAKQFMENGRLETKATKNIRLAKIRSQRLRHRGCVARRCALEQLLRAIDRSVRHRLLYGTTATFWIRQVGQSGRWPLGPHSRFRPAACQFMRCAANGVNPRTGHSRPAQRRPRKSPMCMMLQNAPRSAKEPLY